MEILTFVEERKMVVRWYCLLLSAYCLVLSSGFAAAEVPALIRYQGQLMDRKGVSLEGPYTLTFRLYETETDGTPVWQEQQEQVPLAQGQFSVLLGQVQPLTNMDWAHPCWLSIQVNSDPELAPRQRITSVPLALRARMAEQLTVPVTTSTITDDANKLVPTGAIILWTGASCPSGYARVSAMDGKFLASGSSYNQAAGGSNTHTHGAGSYRGPLHSHTGQTSTPNSGLQPDGGSGDRQYTRWDHAHPFTTNSSGDESVTGTSASADSRPEFATVLLCQKN